MNRNFRVFPVLESLETPPAFCAAAEEFWAIRPSAVIQLALHAAAGPRPAQLAGDQPTRHYDEPDMPQLLPLPPGGACPPTLPAFNAPSRDQFGQANI